MDFILCQGVDITLTNAVSTNPEQELHHCKLDLPSMKSRYGEEWMIWPEGRSYKGMVSGLEGGWVAGSPVFITNLKIFTLPHHYFPIITYSIMYESERSEGNKK